MVVMVVFVMMVVVVPSPVEARQVASCRMLGWFVSGTPWWIGVWTDVKGT